MCTWFSQAYGNPNEYVINTNCAHHLSHQEWFIIIIIIIAIIC